MARGSAPRSGPRALKKAHRKSASPHTYPRNVCCGTLPSMARTFPGTRIVRPTSKPPHLREVIRDLGPAEFGNGLLAITFSASGPLAVILQGAANGGLTAEQSSSWIFATFLGNGLLTLLLTWLYRSPQAYGWTIPGTILAADALTRFSFAEVIGAYLVTGVVVLLLGLSGVVTRVMQAIPYEIVMAMVAGVFLSFGIQLVTNTAADPGLGLPMMCVFILFSVVTSLSKIVPPALAAAIAGTVIAYALGRGSTDVFGGGILATPVLTMPEFSGAALLELVIPLAITVIVVQNGQGVAVLKAAGHQPDANLAAFACGVWTLPQALLGSVPTALTGPTNALIASSPEHRRHYTAAMSNGALAIAIGLFAPVAVGFMMGMPAEFVAVLAGLAMLGPLQNAFVGAFSARFSTGALTCFLITVANLSVAGVSAPFWGILIGCAVAYVMDRE